MMVEWGFQLKLNSKRKIVRLILLSIGIIVVESKETMEGAHTCFAITN